MSAETITRRAFGFLPGPLRERIAFGWANKRSYIEHIEQSYANAQEIVLSRAQTEEEKLTVFFGDRDGYYAFRHKNGLALYFSAMAILQRDDLIQYKDGIGFYNLNGTLVLNPEAVDLFEQGTPRVFALGLKRGKFSTELFAIKKSTFSINIRGLNNPDVLLNGKLYLRDVNDRDRFKISLSLNAEQLPS